MIDLVIMAGGKGERMKPYSEVLPKPLLLYHGKPMIEYIIEQYKDYVNNIYVLACYKAELLQAYFAHKDVRVFIEEQPCGTIGGINILKNILSDAIIVANCDVIVNYNVQEILDYYMNNKIDLMAISFEHDVVVPYGIFEFDSSGNLVGLREKPKIKLVANAGIYIIRRTIIDIINPIMNADELIYSAMNTEYVTEVYLAEGEYIDMSKLQEAYYGI